MDKNVEGYKAVARLKTGQPGLVWCYVSADAIHFEEGWIMHSCPHGDYFE